MTTRIYLSPPHMSGEELQYIHEAFDTNWVAPAGPHLDAFEKELCAYNGISFGAALSSGTAAIHLALIMLGVKSRDEVICSTFTFSGSCNPIAYLQATPVFVDSEADTWNMDPDVLEGAIKDRIRKGIKPKAIIVVHLYGMPAQIKKIMDVAASYEIPVIEDAAEALGSTYAGQKLGTYGDIGIFSFNGNKIITTSGGGAMVSENQGWIRQAKFLSTQARDAAPYYQHSQIGYNYRLSNICAGIGRGQLRALDSRVEQRRKNFEFYRQRFSGNELISFQPELPESYSNRWLTCILFPESHAKLSEEISIRLETENIESRPLWKPMHLQPVFKNAPYYGGAVSESLFYRGLCLPSGTAMTVKDLERVCSCIEHQLSLKTSQL